MHLRMSRTGDHERWLLPVELTQGKKLYPIEMGSILWGYVLSSDIAGISFVQISLEMTDPLTRVTPSPSCTSVSFLSKHIQKIPIVQNSKPVMGQPSDIM